MALRKPGLLQRLKAPGNVLNYSEFLRLKYCEYPDSCLKILLRHQARGQTDKIKQRLIEPF